MTAAHCYFKDQPSHYKVMAGTTDIEGKAPVGVFSVVKGFIPHVEYEENTGINDIALMVLQTRLELNGRTIAAIPLARHGIPYKKMGLVTGW